MRIVYPLLWSRPDRHACRAQTMNTVAALARLGHEVTLLMPRPRGAPALAPQDLAAYFEVDGGFGLVQRPSRWHGGDLVTSLLWLRQVFADPLLHTADVFYSRIPAMLAVGQRAPLPFATDHYRPFPDQIPAVRPLVRRTAAHPGCIGLVLHSHFAAGAYRRAGVAEDRILVAHNGAATVGEPVASEVARAALGLDTDGPIAVYAGRLNNAKGLDQLFALARLRPAMRFLLVGSEGDGPIERQARAMTNVAIVPWQPPARLPLWLQAADVLLVPPSSAPLERFGTCVLPMKLFAYLAAGRPILAPGTPDMTELLEDGANALLVPPNDPVKAAAALNRILEDRRLAAKLGAAARRLSDGLTWDGRARLIAAFLEAGLAGLRECGYRSRCSGTAGDSSPNQLEREFDRWDLARAPRRHRGQSSPPAVSAMDRALSWRSTTA